MSSSSPPLPFAARAGSASDAASSLDALPKGELARVVALEVPAGDAALLRAMGLSEGESVRVLRRAPFGDPLHVRVGSGAELALAAPLARSVRVESTPLAKGNAPLSGSRPVGPLR